MKFDRERQWRLHIANADVPIVECVGSREPARMQAGLRQKEIRSDVRVDSANLVLPIALTTRVIFLALLRNC